MPASSWTDALDVMHTLLQTIDPQEPTQTKELWEWVVGASRRWRTLYKSEGARALQDALGERGVVFALSSWKQLRQAASLVPFAWVELGSTGVGPQALADARMQQVVSLTLDHKVLHSGHIRALCTNPHLSNVRALCIRHCKLPGYHFEAISMSRHLSGVTHLDVSFNALGPMSTSSISKTSWMRRLRALNLSDNPLREKGALNVLASSYDRLEVLDMSRCQVGNESVRALSDNPAFEALRELDLTDNHISDAGALCLAQSEVLGALERLNVSGNGVRDEGALALTQRAQEDGWTLDLARNPMSLQWLSGQGSVEAEPQRPWERAFGQLRSLLASYPTQTLTHHLSASPWWGNYGIRGLGDPLMNMLEDLSDQFPIQYTEQAIPYVQGALARQGGDVLCHARDWEELRRFATVAPFARFDFDAAALTLNQLKDPLLKSVHTLDLSRKHWSGARSRNALTHNPMLESVRALDISGIDSADLLEALLGSVSQRLESLCLNTHSLGARAADLLIESAQASTLSSLTLGIGRGQTSACMERLAQRGVFPALRRIHLYGSYHEAADLRRWLCSRMFDHVEDLVLELHGIQGDVVGALVDGFQGRRLLKLKLSDRDLRDEDITAIFDSPALKNLEVCVLGTPHVRHTATKAIGQSTCMQSMRWLNLNSQRMKRGYATQLFGRADWPALEGLRLNWARLCSKRAQVLSRAPFESLTSLNLSQTWFEPGALEVLVQAPWFSRLKSLSLTGCGLNGELAEVLFRAPLDALMYLNLQSNRLGTQGARALSACGLPSLQWLNLDTNLIGDDGLEALLESPGLGQLRGMSLSMCDLTVRGVQTLSQHPMLAQLEVLDVSNNRLTAKGRRALDQTPFMHPRRLNNAGR